MGWRRSVGWPWLCVLLAGCATTTPHAERPCFSCDEQRLVRIVSRAPATMTGADAGGAPPVRLELHEWERLLRSVMARSVRQPMLGASYRGSAEAVFSDEEVRYLGTSLSRAFQDATGQEQIVFALARPSETGATQVTSGAWFVEAGRIHLRLANCRVAVTMPSIWREIWKDPLFAQAGTFYELVPGEHQGLVPAPSDGGSLFRPDPAELVIDDAGRREEVVPTVPEEASTLPSPSSLEERLAVLKRLREQGLITEEDYRLKKQQLLDRL